MKKSVLSMLFFGATVFAAVSCATVYAQENEAESLDIQYAHDWEDEYPLEVQSYLDGYDAQPIDDKDYSAYFEGVELIGHQDALSLAANCEQYGVVTATCYACKSPDFLEMVNEYGNDVYTLDYQTVRDRMTESISCYDCHGNTPGEIVISRDWMKTETTAGLEGIQEENLACVQCHTVYTDDEETGGFKLSFKYGVDAESVLKYWEEIEYYTGVDEETGTQMMNVGQHTEIASVTGSAMDKMGVSCADCHMDKKVSEDGTEYTNHFWESPVKSETLIADNCLTCHTNETTESMKETIAQKQEETAEATETATATVEEFHTKLAEAVEAGELSEDILNQARDEYRYAVYYLEFQESEASSGAHNSAFNNECIEKALACVDAGMELLK